MSDMSEQIPEQYAARRRYFADRMLAEVEAAGPSELEQARAALEARAESWVEEQGGYPDVVYSWPPGYTTMACADHDGAPEANFYRNRDLIRWYRRARTMLKRYHAEGMDIAEAMSETEPAADEWTTE